MYSNDVANANVGRPTCARMCVCMLFLVLAATFFVFLQRARQDALIVGGVKFGAKMGFKCAMCAGALL